MINIIVIEKGLSNEKRESIIIYVDDLAEYARVFLATMEMTFEISWLCIQLIFFC